MTATGYLAWEGPVNAHAVFEAARRALPVFAVKFAPDLGDVPVDRVNHGDGDVTLSHPMGVGLPAWIYLTYGTDGRLTTSPEECEDNPNDLRYNGTQAGILAVDTGYAAAREIIPAVLAAAQAYCRDHGATTHVMVDTTGDWRPDAADLYAPEPTLAERATAAIGGRW